jgi:HSP20 family protein
MDNQQSRGPQSPFSSQQGSQMSQQGGPSSQQGSSQQQQAGQMGGQQGSTSSPQQGGQQQQFSSTGGQQGGTVRRGGSGGPGMPSLFGGFGGRGGPFEMLRRLDEDVDRLFHEFIGGGRNLLRGGGPRGAGAQASMWLPQVEVCEQGGKLHVYADLPGLSKEDVQISIQDDQLVVQGERRSSSEEGQQGSGYYHSERSYGSFFRSIPLPEGVNPETAEASFKDGVLDVCFDAPNRQPRSRQIPIREGGPATGSASGAAAGSSGSVGSGSAMSGGLGATGSMSSSGSGGSTPASSAAGSEVGPLD